MTLYVFGRCMTNAGCNERGLQVKAEQDETETIYAAREAAEADGAGRIPMDAFKAVISALQVRHHQLESA